ncbi:acyl-CoA dehydrogenase [Oligoflexaceae bacterium]|nr:acyl-CoA dehydrogenase [Oligoflexaceae bacterium]
MIPDQIAGFIVDHYPVIGLIATVGFFTLLGFFDAPLIIWSVAILATSVGLGDTGFFTAAIGVVLFIFNVTPLRQVLVTKIVMKILDAMKLMPKISETEKTALEAGTTWIDGELFSGKPDFKNILSQSYPNLTPAEKAFIEGPVEELCKMATDWEIFQHKDLPDRVWDFLKKEKFFGMIIPEKFGGLGFSGLCHSEVVQKLTSRSVPLAVTVMVPNSLGPAELIMHYGTDAQKEHYLPRLANGTEIPCFALTEPTAGSDAGSMTSRGEVFKGDDGQLYVRLNWNKRYITLAAVSTIVGLAVRLYDPENLLGKGTDLGITCLMVPSETPGVILGQRHNPLGVPFYNCPTKGENVVVSAEQIIGGTDFAGKGWQMLMESLAAGRAISLPAQSVGNSKLVTRVTSAYTMIREQFGMPIGKFEGIEEKLAHIFGMTYLLEASRVFTCGAVDNGMKPSVVSAIMKYNATEIARDLLNDGMDVLGGAGISRGPRNIIGNAYIATPIGITVEGANILTRCMIVFGQGAIRCHPHAYNEVKAMEEGDLKAFDKAFWGHVGFVVRNKCRMILLGLTRGYLIPAPKTPLRRYYQKLSWASATFAFFSDLAMGTLGGKLKFKEKLTGRYADMLSWMFLATSVLKRFESEGQKKEHLPYAEFALQHAFSEIQKAFIGILSNFEIPLLGWFFRSPLVLIQKMNSFGEVPSDQLGQRIVKPLLKPSALRDAFTTGIFIPKTAPEALGRYEEAFQKSYDAQGPIKKIRAAEAEKKIDRKASWSDRIAKAKELGVINADEESLIREAHELKMDAIEVDQFALDDFAPTLLETREDSAVS